MRRTFPRFGARKAAVVFTSTAPIMGADAPNVKGDGIARPKSKAHKAFADRLRTTMARRGLEGRGGATRLAESIGATPQLVASWLRAERMPNATYLGKLTVALQVALEELVSVLPTGDEAGEGTASDAEFFVWGAEAARRLLGPDVEGVPPGVQLKLLEITEADAVAKFGPRARAVAEEIRREIRRRHGLPEPGDPAHP